MTRNSLFPVTHVGSLPRPAAVLQSLRSGAPGESLLASAVTDVVRRQVKHGIDIVSDGEWSKASFFGYATDRIAGFTAGPPAPPRGNIWSDSRDALAFPDCYPDSEVVKAALGGRPEIACTGPLSYSGRAALQLDLKRLRAAVDAAGAKDAFVPAISPGNIEVSFKNEHYETDEDYLFAIADAMHEEYRGIVDAGFQVQIDDPQLVTYWNRNPGVDLADFRRWAEVRIEALNHALRGLPADRVRYHTCYSIDIGPRTTDLEMKHVIDLMLRLNAGEYTFEASNPRHEHEWILWREAGLPEDRKLIPGVVTHTTILVEHPELVAQRLIRFAEAVGPERVIAGTDCGFGTLAAMPAPYPDSVIWAKFDALAEGARLAARQLSLVGA